MGGKATIGEGGRIGEEIAVPGNKKRKNGRERKNILGSGAVQILEKIHRCFKTLMKPGITEHRKKVLIYLDAVFADVFKHC